MIFKMNLWTKVLIFITVFINKENNFCCGQFNDLPVLRVIHMGTQILQNGGLFDFGNFDDVHDEIDSIDNGDSIFLPGRYLNTTELIERRGYQTEVHHVVTEDGYILQLTRIVTGKLGNYLPVLLQHGVLAASDQWLLRGHNKDLAFLLADNGFDVWLGDQRGDVYSRSHVKFKTNDKKFWDFSFHESGIYDIPAFIKTILERTNAPQLSYIGHSMGTTVFFVMAAQRPDVAQKVKLAILLAPVCFPPKPSQSSIINLLLPNADMLMNSLARLNTYEFLPRIPEAIRAVHRFCNKRMAMDLCLSVVGNIYGDNRKNLDRELVPFYFSSVPAGTSLKTIGHLTQIFRTGLFQQYDYGTEGNLAKYGQRTPPRYKVEEIKTQIALVYGNNDGFVSRKSVRKLASTLPNVVLKYEVIDPNFSHLDFMFGNDAKPLVHDKLFKLLKAYNAVTLK